MKSKISPNSHDIVSEEKKSLIDEDKCSNNKHTKYCSNSPEQIRLILLLIFAASGSSLFGYNTAVVSGAMLKVNIYFGLTTLWHELIVSVMIASLAVGALVTSWLSEKLGRRRIISLAALTILVGAVFSAASFEKYALVCGRIFTGFGCGAIFSTIPVYIAELSSSQLRGKLLFMSVIFNNGGQLVAVLIDGCFSSLDNNIGWRLMFSFVGIPAIVIFIGFIFMPESPRWLVFHGKDDKAEIVLSSLREQSKVPEELKLIQNDCHSSTNNQGIRMIIKRLLTNRRVLLAIFVGSSLQILQQFTGVNMVIYYGASVMKMVGFNDNNAIWLASTIPFLNTVLTFVGLIFVDKFGRKKLLLFSLSGAGLGLALLSGSFILSDQFSLSTKPFQPGVCDYSNCQSCIDDPQCAYCAVYNQLQHSYIDGTCLLSYTQHSQYYANNNTQNCQVFTDAEESNDNNNNNSNKTAILFYSSTKCPNSKSFSWLSILGIFVFIIFFAIGLGPLPSTINAEIYPTWARSTGFSISIVSYAISNVFLLQTFLTFTNMFGRSCVFGLFACETFLSIIFVIFFLPETKGVKLEGIERLFNKPPFLQWCH